MPIAEATQTHQITRPLNLEVSPPAAIYRPFEPATTESINFLPQLDNLLTVENAHGYTFQASTRAYRNTRRMLEIASALMGRSFPKPEFVPDGEGGIDTEWSNRERSVTLSCRGRHNQEDFIYWEENGDYDGGQVTVRALLERLQWLNG